MNVEGYLYPSHIASTDTQNVDSTKLKYVKSRYYAYRPIQITTHGRGLAVIELQKADSHIACRAHAVPLPCRAVPLRV